MNAVALGCPRRHARRGIAAALLLVVCLAAQPAAQSTGRSPSALLMLPQRSTAPVAATIEHTFRKALESAVGSAVDLRVEYLDYTDLAPEDYVERLAALLELKYAGVPVDVVVVHRPEALSFLLANRQRLFPGIPVVAFDLPAEEFEKLDPQPGVTAVLDGPQRQRTVDAALQLFPGTAQVVIVSGASAFDRRTEALARRLVLDRPAPPGVVSLAGLPLDEQVRHLGALPPNSVVVFTSYRADSSGQSTIASEMLRRVTRASSAPVFAASMTFMGLGIVGGDLIQYEEVARPAAARVARILNGEPVTSLPAVTVQGSALTFDWRELQRWHIPESRLPSDSVVLFRETTLWSDYRGYILGAAGLLAAQGFLIAGLLVERRRRQQAQAGLIEAERRYRTVADFTADWEYWTRPDGTFLYVSPSCASITGYSATDFIDRAALLDEMVLDDDRPRWADHRAHAGTVGEPSALEFRIRRRDGAIRWIDHVCSPVKTADGTDLGVRGSNRDITARKDSEADLRRALDEIKELRDRLEIDYSYLREQVQPEGGIKGLLGASDVMRYVVSRVQQVAPTTSTVLLLGETGTGKSLVAQAIHDLSPRSVRPLVTLNCAALPPTLIESELFGHEKGAFSGAVARRLGRFEIANHGTLFLDEIGELPLDLQAKLLRAVQEGEFERVGGSLTLKTDVRVIAATNRKLEDEVRAGRFRQDLWYRLNVFPITVPPLRQRPEDVPILVNHFLEKHCRRMGRPVLDMPKGTLRALQARDWPGNIRELENVVERAVIASRGSRFEVEDEPASTRDAAAAEAGTTGTLAQLERTHIVATLARLDGRIEGRGGAAEYLGLNPSTLRARMRKHGIVRPVGLVPPVGTERRPPAG